MSRWLLRYTLSSSSLRRGSVCSTWVVSPGLRSAPGSRRSPPCARPGAAPPPATCNRGWRVGTCKCTSTLIYMYLYMYIYNVHEHACRCSNPQEITCWSANASLSIVTVYSSDLHICCNSCFAALFLVDLCHAPAVRRAAGWAGARTSRAPPCRGRRPAAARASLPPASSSRSAGLQTHHSSCRKTSQTDAPNDDDYGDDVLYAGTCIRHVHKLYPVVVCIIQIKITKSVIDRKSSLLKSHLSDVCFLQNLVKHLLYLEGKWKKPMQIKYYFTDESHVYTYNATTLCLPQVTVHANQLKTTSQRKEINQIVSSKISKRKWNICTWAATIPGVASQTIRLRKWRLAN